MKTLTPERLAALDDTERHQYVRTSDLNLAMHLETIACLRLDLQRARAMLDAHASEHTPHTPILVEHAVREKFAAAAAEAEAHADDRCPECGAKARIKDGGPCDDCEEELARLPGWCR